MTNYTIDASVFINGFDTSETGYATSQKFLALLQAQAISVIEPSIALIEIAGAISRTRNDPNRAQIFANALYALPYISYIHLDDMLVQLAKEIAAKQQLRGIDAVYVAVVLHYTTTLVSLDHEHLTRAACIVPVQTPGEALAIYQT